MSLIYTTVHITGLIHSQLTWRTIMLRKTSTIPTLIMTLLASAGSALAQADFAEDFESLASAPFGFEPQVLIDQGWEFRNQSEPVDGAAWVPGDNFGGEPFDVSAFLNAFNTGDPLADLTGDGNLDFFDVSAFLNAFSTGCP